MTEVWRRGSVIASWLLDLTAHALLADPSPRRLLRPRVRFGRGPLDGPGGGRHVRTGAVLTAALYERFSSRGEADFADRVLSAMRYEFGGHLEKTGG